MQTICIQLNGIKNSYQIQIIFKQIYGILTGAVSPGQSGLGNNRIEGVLHTFQSSKNWNKKYRDNICYQSVIKENVYFDLR